ncbi:MAG: AAA family ATPase [Candidatus Altiarchaeota archaeon]
MLSLGEPLEGFLGGGLPEKALSMVFGGWGAGKSNFALIAAGQAARKGKVLFVDCKNGFSTERLKQLFPEDIDSILGNILVIEPNDFDQQKVAVKRLEEFLAKEKFSLVIVDSIIHQYWVQVDRDFRDIERQLAQLMRLSKIYGLPVLVTSRPTYDREKGTTKPFGGESIPYWFSVIIEFIREEEFGGYSKRFMVLRKHPSLKEGKALEFKIEDRGIVKVRELNPREVKSSQEKN